MNKLFSLITGATLLGASLMVVAPAAMARDNVDWSVTVGSGGYGGYGGYGYPAPVVVQPPVVVHQPPVVVHRPVPMVGYGAYYGAPAPRYIQGPGWRHHHGHRHGHGHHHGGHRGGHGGHGRHGH